MLASRLPTTTVHPGRASPRRASSGTLAPLPRVGCHFRCWRGRPIKSGSLLPSLPRTNSLSPNPTHRLLNCRAAGTDWPGLLSAPVKACPGTFILPAPTQTIYDVPFALTDSGEHGGAACGFVQPLWDTPQIGTAPPLECPQDVARAVRFRKGLGFMRLRHRSMVPRRGCGTEFLQGSVAFSSGTQGDHGVRRSTSGRKSLPRFQ